MSVKPYIDLSGGMNINTSPLFMKENECEVIQNYHLDILGSLTKRPGIAYLIGQITDNIPILNMYFFKDSQGTDNSNVLVGLNATGGGSQVIKKITTNAWANSKTGDTASAIPVFATFIDYVFRTNGADAMGTSADLTSWGTTNALATLLPKFVTVWEDRVWALNDNSSTKYPSRIYWSSLPSGTPLAITWTPASNYADINPDDNDSITWGEPFGKVLLIFKEKAIYRFTFGQVEPDKMPGVQGTPQGLTVKQTQGICFWANKYGVWALSNPYGIPQLISKRMQSFIDAIPTLANMRAEVDQDHYKLYIGDVTVERETYNNCVLVYTISKKTWHIETYPFEVKAMARMERKTLGTTEIYDDIYLGDDDGFVYRTNTGTADYNGTTQTPISGKILTKEYPLPLFPYKSELKKMWVLAKYGIGARVNYRLDRKSDTPWNSFGDVTERVTEKTLSGKGRTIQLSITDNSVQKSQIDGFLIEDVDVKRGRKDD